MKEIDGFFKKYNFNPHIKIEEAVSLLLEDMQRGLSSDFKNSSMDMIPLWRSIPHELPKNKNVIIIDAGGTNFRAGLVNFDKNGTASISSFLKYPMPALDREMTNEEFFDTIADYLEPLKNSAEVISFCFSFAIKIFPDGGGETIKLSKEIKLPHIAGCRINEALLQALVRKGWTSVKKAVMVNDTAAVLQSGLLSKNKNNPTSAYDTFIGFVLGTGLNSAYIEYGKIEKLSGTEFYSKPQIIVCESGKCNKVKQSDFDKALTSNSNLKNEYFLERMCSGRYIGELCSIALRFAANEGMFSTDVNEKMKILKNLTAEEVSVFLKEQNHNKNIFSDMLPKEEISPDYIKIYLICASLFERDALLAASVIAASALKTGKGKSAEKPICITANGSVFLHGFLMKEKIFRYLYEFLTEKKGIYFELKTPEDSVTFGTAISVF